MRGSRCHRGHCPPRTWFRLLPVDAGKASMEDRCVVMTGLGPDTSVRGAKSAQDFGSLAFRFLVAIDVEGFSQRHAAEQARAQDDLEHAMFQAAANAGLDREHWYRQPRGDGELVVLPEGVNGLSLVADYPRKLASAVAGVNQAGKREPRLRVRLAIHHGAVAPGRFGPVGAAPVVISRLVDAETLRQQLRQRSELDIALIVSATVYNEVIQSRLHDLNPEAFRRTIIRAKGITYAAYLYQGIFAPDDHMIPAPRQQPVTA
jgi:hypothetical protein